MEHRHSTPLQLGLLVLLFLLQVDAREVMKNIQMSTVVRTDPRSICLTSSIEPALKCGCFIYHSIFSSNTSWRFIEDACLEKLSGSIQRGERYCQSSAYGNGVGSSIPGESLHQLRIRATQFFKDASRHCVPTEKVTPLLRERSMSPEVQNKSETYASVDVGDWNGTNSARTVVSNDDGLSSSTDSGTTRVASVNSSQDSIGAMPVSRGEAITDSATEKMRHFCEVLVVSFQHGSISSCGPKKVKET